MEDMIKEPYINDFCDKCIYIDGEEVGSQYCKILRYVNCGQILECNAYSKKQIINGYNEKENKK